MKSSLFISFKKAYTFSHMCSDAYNYKFLIVNIKGDGYLAIIKRN